MLAYTLRDNYPELLHDFVSTFGRHDPMIVATLDGYFAHLPANGR